jgi:hypothetical protein
MLPTVRGKDPTSTIFSVICTRINLRDLEGEEGGVVKKAHLISVNQVTPAG